MALAVGDAVLPGETLDSIMNAASDKNKVILGNGLRFEGISRNEILVSLKYFILDATSMQKTASRRQ